MTYGLGGGSVETHEHTISNHAEYDLTKRTVLVAGIEEYQNTADLPRSPHHGVWRRRHHHRRLAAPASCRSSAASASSTSNSTARP